MECSNNLTTSSHTNTRCLMEEIQTSAHREPLSCRFTSPVAVYLSLLSLGVKVARSTPWTSIILEDLRLEQEDLMVVSL